jgi:hypothetical protein
MRDLPERHPLAGSLGKNATGVTSQTYHTHD